MSPVTIILFSIFACIVSFWIRWRKRRMSLFERYGIPGPKPSLITGNLIEFNKKREKCINEWMEKYGKIFGFFMGGKPWIICYDLELIKLIEIKEYKKFINRDVFVPDGGISHYLAFEGLPMLKDEKWKNVRNIISPKFSPGKIKMTSHLICDSIKIFMLKIMKNKEEPIEIYQFYRKLIIDILCKTAMGIDANMQTDETSKFIQSMNNVLEADSVDISTLISILFPEFEPLPTYIRLIANSIKYTMNYPCASVIMNTIRNIINSRMKSQRRQADLLQLLIDAEEDSSGFNRKLTTDSIIGNAALFVLTGYDTTASTLSWCSYYLAKYSDVQENVRQEIKCNIKSNKKIEYADISNLKYLDQVISETLRLNSLPVLLINRICSENFQYKNITIPKDVTVSFPARSIHKDPNYWNDPEKFDPERFSNNIAETLDASMYQPFGAGPRGCIGMKLGQAILKLTLANLIRSFKLELHGNMEVEEEYSLFTVRPKNGITVKLTSIVS